MLWSMVSSKSTDGASETAVVFDCVESREAFEPRTALARVDLLDFLGCFENSKNEQSEERR